MAGDSATSRTFGVIELLEMILVTFDIKDVLKLKRVCKQWNEVITTSKQLRQICFLEPLEATRVAVGSRENFCFETGVKITSAGKPQNQGLCRLTIVQQHPALKLASAGLISIGGNGEEFGIHYNLHHGNIEDILEQSSDLDEMFLTQPPFKTVFVVTESTSRVGHHFREEGGFTFGKFREVVLKEWRKDEVFMYVDIPGILSDDQLQWYDEENGNA